MRSVAAVASLVLLACAPAGADRSGASPRLPGLPAPDVPADASSGSPSIDEDVAFLRLHAPIDVLDAPGGGKVVVSARWQGRVMTSAVEPGGPSLGFVHRAFIEAGKTGTAFDNYGGEDRFWLGPEGGQYGLYFAPGARFVFEAWQTPHGLQEGEWSVAGRDALHITFVRTLHVVNWSGAEFDVAVERTVRVLSADEVGARFGEGPPPGAKWVAFETVNRIANAGKRGWTADSGLLSVWILGMYRPSADSQVVVPFDPSAPGPVVHDAYFGKVPRERLAVHERDGWLAFVADGKYRSKIGLSPARARDTMGSFSPSSHLLTLVRYHKPASAPQGYVNSAWAKQEEPYAGDVVNSYNDGPTEPGGASLGGFYELESSSPAAALAPGESLEHVHTTLHVVADPAALDGLARRALGVSLAVVARPPGAG